MILDRHRRRSQLRGLIAVTTAAGLAALGAASVTAAGTLSITVSGAGSGSGSAPGASYLPDDGQPMTLGQGSSAGSGTYFYTGEIASAEISVT